MSASNRIFQDFTKARLILEEKYNEHKNIGKGEQALLKMFATKGIGQKKNILNIF